MCGYLHLLGPTADAFRWPVNATDETARSAERVLIAFSINLRFSVLKNGSKHYAKSAQRSHF